MRNLGLAAFYAAFGVRAECQDMDLLAAALGSFRGSSSFRNLYVKQAAVDLLQFEPCEARLLPLLQAWSGSPITQAPFFDRSREWLMQPPFVDNFGVALSKLLLSWAPHALEWPVGYAQADVEQQFQSELRQRQKWGSVGRRLEQELARAERSGVFTPAVAELLTQRIRGQIAVMVNDRFCKLLGGRALLQYDSQAVELLRGADLQLVQLQTGVIADSLTKLAAAGCDTATLCSLVHYWCWALQRTPGCWEAMRQICWTATEMVEPGAWPPSAATKPPAAETMVLWQWWLHGSSFAGVDPQIPAVAKHVWSNCERIRAQLSPELAVVYDEREMFGAARYTLEALAQHAWRAAQRKAAPAEQQRLGRQLGLYLETYATRMALHRLLADDSTQVGRAAGAAKSSAASSNPDEWQADPNPEDPLTQFGIKNEFPFAAQTMAWQTKPATSQLELLAPPKIEARAWSDLTQPLEAADLQSLLPRNCAYLGLYDLPRCSDSPLPGRPVAMLIVNTQDGEILLDCRTSARGDMAGNIAVDTAGEFLQAFDRQVNRAFQRYCAELIHNEAAARRHLAVELAAAFEDRQRSINDCYADLIDGLCESIAQQLGGRDLRELDLIVCPRGMTTTAVVDLLGTKATLHERFRSISISPGLRVWHHLWQRAMSVPPRNPPLRIGIAGWDGSLKEDAGQPSSPMVRALMRYAEDQLIAPFARGASPLTEVFLAAEKPVASVRRTSRMAASSDYMIIFGHGSLQPCGIRLADGIFPTGNEPFAASRWPAAVFNCACFGGRKVQELIRGDALNPILADLSLSMALDAATVGNRAPSLVAGFIHQVPGIWAGECVVDILRDRLTATQDGQGLEHRGFQLAACRQHILARYLNACGPTGREQLLRGAMVAAAERCSDAFLSFYCAANLQLTGAERQA